MSNDSISLDDISGGSRSWGGEDFGVGDKISGTVVRAERVQQQDFTTGEPLHWSNGDPRMLSRVIIATDLRDSDDDDGQRALYLKGGRFEAAEGSGMSGESALAEAMKQAGTKSIEPGGKLQVAITGLGKATQRGYRPPKLFTIKYTAPVASISASDLFAD